MTAKRHVERPGHVFVVAKTYEIVWLTEEEWHNNNLNESDAGLTYSSRNMIYMRLMPMSTEGNYQEILLHEITHAVWAETHLTHLNLTEPEEPEEAIIGIQTHGLLFVLQQNPHVTKYLTSDGALRR